MYPTVFKLKLNSIRFLSFSNQCQVVSSGLLCVLLLLGSYHCEEISSLPNWRNIYKHYEPLIARYGHEMISFLECMGPKWVVYCGPQIAACAAAPNPLTCLPFIICGGRNAGPCVESSFINNDTNIIIRTAKTS